MRGQNDIVGAVFLLNRFHVDLSADGSATLTRDETGRWLADGLVGLAQRGILFALATTLIVELLVVGLILGVPERQLPGKACVTCLLVNLLTLPALWVACLIAFWMFGLWGGLVVFLVLEFAVVFVEGGVYAGAVRIPLGKAFGLALAANAASFLLGLAVG